VRSGVLIATKAGLEWEDGSVFRNASRARIMREVEDSLAHRYLSGLLGRPIGDDRRKPPRRCTRCSGTERFAPSVSAFFGQPDGPVRRVAPLHVLQPPYNLFERGIEAGLLPYCRKHKIATLGYGALCRGLLSGRMRPDTVFEGDDLRRTDPKFLEPRFVQYLAAVERLDRLARQRFGKRVIHWAIRWMLDQGNHHGAVGRASSRSTTAGRGGDGLGARCARLARFFFYERLCNSVGCSHMSGLYARLLRPLALMISAN